MEGLPIIDVQALIRQDGNKDIVAQELRKACQNFGFFYIVGHGISPELQKELEVHSKQFFDQSLESKMQIRMALGGRAWRGYFPVGGELTSGKPDLKEGLYFGAELGPDDERVKRGLILHGANLFPANLSTFKAIVLEYMEALTNLGHRLMEGLALSLGLSENYFTERYTNDPLTLFRVFHYPSQVNSPELNAPWGVGEHTDYGVLTILKQDDIGGLQVKTQEKWLDAPYIPNSFVCNIGDMLDRMTGGYYRSTPHRVKNNSSESRYSYPFFFDPNFDAKIERIDLGHVALPENNTQNRWDKKNIHEFRGTYGDYILDKIGKVFPELLK